MSRNFLKAENGCLEDFENTASFSRRYQAAQDCMCDTEHMFDCPNTSEDVDREDYEFNRFLQQAMVDPTFQHKNLVAKKYNINKDPGLNPFLTGEKLPVAAKKGHNVFY